MLLSAVSFLVVAQSSSEVPEGLMNNPVCGPTKENGQWRIKTNAELITKYKSQDTVTNKDSKIGMAWTHY